MANDPYGNEWTDQANGYQACLVSANTIKPTPVRWLWKNYLAKGKLHILGGMAGTGKTTLALSLAAIITRAKRFPNGEAYLKQGKVLIWSAEDDPSDTLVPRLQAAGANTANVYLIQGRVNPINQKIEPFDPAVDIRLLNQQLKQIGDIDLLIIDPIVSAVKGDMNKSNDVRRALQSIVDFAQTHDCAVIGITHFSKGTNGSNPLERVTGSVAFGALPRIVLVAAKEQESENRVLAIAKSNIGSDNGGITYQLEQVQLENHITTSKVKWGDTLQGSAQEILDKIEQPHIDHRENNEPAELLKQLLSEGKLPLAEVKSIMKKNGVTDKQLRTAREKLNIKSIRTGFGKELQTYLTLPTLSSNAQGVSISPSLYMGKTEQYGQNCTTTPHSNQEVDKRSLKEILNLTDDQEVF